MQKQGHKKSEHALRAQGAKRPGRQAPGSGDSAAEKRLQSILHELDRTDAPEDDDADDSAGGVEDPSHSHEWSDDH